MDHGHSLWNELRAPLRSLQGARPSYRHRFAAPQPHGEPGLRSSRTLVEDLQARRNPAHPAGSDFPKFLRNSFALKILPRRSQGNIPRKLLRLSAVSAAVLFTLSAAAHAQGILTVTPGRSASTTGGTGMVGYSGDGGGATAATLARPSGMAYDAAGNVFLADANNHVIREISAAGVITTVAGTGIAGFGGDGGPATAAFLDTPTGVAVDASGTLFIADSHNHRIRKIAGDTITTIAGTGTAGFAGDGGASASAQLASPNGVAVDASGNLYIADTDNQRIRRIAGGIITTVAGNGEELFSGDGGRATAASLDEPTGVAVDSFGSLYIADKNDQRVRMVGAAGIISTLAGSGTPSLAGGFSGDGAAANSAFLAKPAGVAVDRQGSVYVADTNNQRIRQIAEGSIVTIAGTGDQGFGGDGGPAPSATLNSPRAVMADSVGNLSIADTLNGRLRFGALGMLSFGSQVTGTTSSPQPVTLTNSGTGSLTVAAVDASGPFATAAGAPAPLCQSFYPRARAARRSLRSSLSRRVPRVDPCSLVLPVHPYSRSC